MFAELAAPLPAGSAGPCAELNLRLPANNCLLVFLVVEVVGLRVVELIDGAEVVLVVELVARDAAAVSLVWNRLFLLPNFRDLVEEVASAELSVVVEMLPSVDDGLLDCCAVVAGEVELTELIVLLP